MRKRWLVPLIVLGLLPPMLAWAGSSIFTEHTIEGDFYNAKRVYASHVGASLLACPVPHAN